jgi:hypothetical protein
MEVHNNCFFEDSEIKKVKINMILNKLLKPTEKKEDNESESLKDFILAQLNKFFINHIPIDSLKDLSPTCKL